MRRFSRLAVWGILVLGMGVVASPAQLLNEILRGAVNGVDSDIFGCGSGAAACGLSFRMYSTVSPGEVNGPANPVDGIPRYKPRPRRYLSDSQTTANFPVSAGGGAGNNWYMVWDGITNAGTTDFIGWYGAQSQKVNFGEIGNALSFNCLPVIAQEACFKALDTSNAFNDSARDNGASISHLGGISPIPCPTLTTNGLNSIDLDWDQAANQTANDGAGAALTGYDLYLLGDKTGTDADFASSAVLVASIPDLTTTSMSVDRGTLPGSLPGATLFQGAIKLQYAGGLSSKFFSCSSALTGQIITSEPGDVNSLVDVLNVTTEVRVESLMAGGTRDMLMFHINMNGQPIRRPGQAIKYKLNFLDPVSSKRRVAIKAEFRDEDDSHRHPGSGTDLKLRFEGKGGKLLRGKVGAVVDDPNGILTFVVDPVVMATAVEPRQGPLDVSALVTGEVKLMDLKDTFAGTNAVFIGVNSPLADEDDSGKKDKK